MSIPNPDLAIGPFVAGTFFNTYLYGLVTYQFASYYQTKSNDRPAVKYMIFGLFIVDTFHSATAVYMTWNEVVASYNTDNLANPPTNMWTYATTPICTAFTALVTQMYLGFRIWRLSDSKILFGMVIVTAVLSSTLGLAFGVEIWLNTPNIAIVPPLVTGWLSTRAAVDAFIACTLVIIFSRSRTGFHRMDTVLNRLIFGSIQTGLFSMIFSLAALVLPFVLPSADFFGTFVIPSGRIYTNTLLHSLLSRQSLRAGLNATYDVSKELGPINWGTMVSSPASPELQLAGNQNQVKSTVL